MTDERRRRELGSSDAPVEDEIVESFDRLVDEGAQRLNRTWSSVLITGLFGGFEVGLGAMAYLAVLHETGSHILAGLVFGIGFIALLLAKSELFTEGFLVPLTAVFAGEATVLQLLKLWSGTLVANLAGGWLFMWLVMQAFPEWAPTVADAARSFVDPGLSVQTACLALLGGSTITVMTRMQHGTESQPVKVVAAMAGGFLISGLGLFHCIVDSLLIFAAIHSGAQLSYLDWLGWLWYTVLFNMIGGLLLVTALRLVRSIPLIEERRSAGDAEAGQ